MFAQFIAAKVSDRAAYTEHMRHWHQEQSERADGWLMGIGGVTAEGKSVMMVLFESEEQARRNSDRPEQSDWWRALLTCLEGTPEVIDSAVVDRFGSGNLMQAGFVQFMRGQVQDQGRARQLSQQMNDDFMPMRPDIIGSVCVWYPGGFVEAVCFTSETEARRGESQPAPEGFTELWGQMEEQTTNLNYYDLTEPVLMSREHAPA